MMLETFKNIEFKGYVPENSRKNITKRMATSHTKVEIFQNGRLDKNLVYWILYTRSLWDVYAFRNTKEKSDLPVIMKIKGFNGIIEPRFLLMQEDGNVHNIFALERDEIASVRRDSFMMNLLEVFMLENQEIITPLNSKIIY
jgi:hypothetical protein